MNELNIQSDFIDYYDDLSNNKSEIIYKRYISNSKQRATALKILRAMGIKTIDIKPVTQFYTDTPYLCVYTNPNAHNNQGKSVVRVEDAKVIYPNYIASSYIQIDKTKGKTMKYLQIGKRRFTLYFQKEDDLSISMGKLIEVRESTPEYNRLIGLPIFSIDYISDGNEMLATDFNEVEELQRIGIQYYLDKQTIIDEIKEALMVYNIN